MSPTKRARRAKRRSLVLGILVVTFGLALYTLSAFSTYGLPLADRTQVKAAFVDTGSLRAGDDVRIANVRVGYVDSIALMEAPSPTGASKVSVATLLLDGGRPVYRNAQANTASVGARSALGQKFVELNTGDPNAGLLPPDEVLPAKDTVGAQELSDVLAVLDLPTRQSLGGFIRNFGGGLAGRGQDISDGFDALPDILPDLGTVSDAFSANGGRDTAALLRSANSLSTSFAGRQEQIGQLLGKLDLTFAALNADGGEPLAETLKVAPDALRDARGALESLDPTLASTRQAVSELRPGGEALGRATPDFRGFLRESPSPLDKVPGVSDDAVPAVEDLTDVASDARPLATMLPKTFDRGGDIVQALAPYSPEISTFFTNVSDGLKFGNNKYRIVRVRPILGTESLSGGLPVRDPTNSRDPSPAPGEAAKQTRYNNTGPSGAITNRPQGVPGR